MYTQDISYHLFSSRLPSSVPIHPLFCHSVTLCYSSLADVTMHTEKLRSHEYCRSFTGHSEGRMLNLCFKFLDFDSDDIL
jgi:hypothetical protein